MNKYLMSMFIILCFFVIKPFSAHAINIYYDRAIAGSVTSSLDGVSISNVYVHLEKGITYEIKIAAQADVNCALFRLNQDFSIANIQGFGNYASFTPPNDAIYGISCLPVDMSREFPILIVVEKLPLSTY